MAHKVETMAYVGDKPWHKLGKELSTPPATVAEAVRAGGVDWEIETQAMYRMVGGDVGPNTYERVPERNVVIRKSDKSVLGTVGADWTPIQNAQAFAPFQPFLDAGEVDVETVGSLNEGRRVWMLGKIKRPDEVIVPQADDRVAKYLLAVVGHDGTLSYHCGETGIRVVCNNTLRIALDGKNTMIKVRHSSNANEAMAEVTNIIARVDARFGEAATIFRALAHVPIQSAEQLRRYVDQVFPKAKPKQIIDATPAEAADLQTLLARPHITTKAVIAPEDKEARRRIYGAIETLFEKGRGADFAGVYRTAWAAYNAVTEYLTWERGKSDDRRLEQAWLAGSGPAAVALPAAMEQFLGAPHLAAAA